MMFLWTCSTVLLKSVGAFTSTEAWGTAKYSAARRRNGRLQPLLGHFGKAVDRCQPAGFRGLAIGTKLVILHPVHQRPSTAMT